MKCTLIRCPQTFAKYVSAASAIPPIGPAYVAASLREAGGDRLICGLLEHLTGRRPLDEVPGCWYRTADGEVRRSCAKVRVRDVDSLPWPAWNLVPLENYLRGHYGAGVDRGRSMPM